MRISQGVIVRGLSPFEFECLIGLIEQTDKEHLLDTTRTLSAENRAALMANNTPAVARKWLEEEGLLDEQIVRGPQASEEEA